MKRREYVSAVGASIVLTGYTTVLGANTNSTTPDSTLRVTTPQHLTPGGKGKITITAHDATTLNISNVPDLDESFLEYGAAEFSIPPQTTYTARPPAWVWERPRTVSVEIPVEIPETVSTKTYHYRITVQRGDSTESVTEQFTLAVTD